MHSDIHNYTKLAFNSLKMIQNDTVYHSANQNECCVYSEEGKADPERRPGGSAVCAKRGARVSRLWTVA